jgi:Tfp pilus assembly major pilin PilA
MLFIAAMIGVVVVLAAKLVPAYTEFMAVKKVINAMDTSGDLKTMTPKEIQASFFKRGEIDNISSVKPEDIEVTRSGDQSTITVAYSVKVPIVANVSAWLDFSASAGR